uniref:PRM1A protein n=1 Tax=Rodentolepis nana TaxID=102285 RepID=A0A0R3TDE6_RODNA
LKICVTAIVSTVSGVFAALVVLVLIFLLGFIYATIMERCFKNTRSPKAPTPACISNVAWLCGLLSIVIMLITVLVICTTFGSAFLFTEGAVYFNQYSDDLRKADHILNGLIRGIWPEIDIMQELGLPPPNNVFNILLNECKLPNVSLLSLIGWKNFPAKPVLLLKEQYPNMLQQWKIFIFPIFENLQKTFSNESDIAKIRMSLAQVAAIQKSILLTQDEFSPRKLERTHLESLSNHMNSIKSMVPQAEDEINNLNQLYQRTMEIKSLMANITEASKQHQTLDELELIAGSFLHWLENLAKELDNPSNLEAIISEILKKISNQIGDSLIDVTHSYSTQLVSCSTLHRTLSGVLETLCGDQGLLQEIFAWGLIVFIEAAILFLIIIFVIFSLYSLNETVPPESVAEITRF